MLKALFDRFMSLFSPAPPAVSIIALNGRPLAAAAPPRSLPKPAAQPRSQPVLNARPVSTSMTRTLRALEANPGISAGELAKLLKVSASYAGKLLRKARTSEEHEPLPCAKASLGAARNGALSVLSPTVQDAGLSSAVAQLTTRLTEAEDVLGRLRRSGPKSKGAMDVNRRADVLRRHERGETPAAIATELEVPVGEVMFILKVQKILTGAA